MPSKSSMKGMEMQQLPSEDSVGSFTANPVADIRPAAADVVVDTDDSSDEEKLSASLSTAPAPASHMLRNSAVAVVCLLVVAAAIGAAVMVVRARSQSLQVPHTFTAQVAATTRGKSAEEFSGTVHKTEAADGEWQVSARVTMPMDDMGAVTVITTLDGAFYYEILDTAAPDADGSGEGQKLMAGCVTPFASPPLVQVAAALQQAVTVPSEHLSATASESCNDGTGRAFAVAWAGRTYVACASAAESGYHVAGPDFTARIYDVNAAVAPTAPFGAPTHVNGSAVVCPRVVFEKDDSSPNTRRLRAAAAAADSQQAVHAELASNPAGQWILREDLHMTPVPVVTSWAKEAFAKRRLGGNDDGGANCCNCRRRRMASSSWSSFGSSLSTAMKDFIEKTQEVVPAVQEPDEPYCVCCLIPGVETPNGWKVPSFCGTTVHVDVDVSKGWNDEDEQKKMCAQLSAYSSGSKLNKMAFFGLSTGNLLLAAAHKNKFCEMEEDAPDYTWTAVSGVLDAVKNPYAFCSNPMGYSQPTHVSTDTWERIVSYSRAPTGAACVQDGTGKWVPSAALLAALPDYNPDVAAVQTIVKSKATAALASISTVATAMDLGGAVSSLETAAADWVQPGVISGTSILSSVRGLSRTSGAARRRLCPNCAPQPDDDEENEAQASTSYFDFDQARTMIVPTGMSWSDMAYANGNSWWGELPVMPTDDTELLSSRRLATYMLPAAGTTTACPNCISVPPSYLILPRSMTSTLSGVYVYFYGIGYIRI